MTTQISQVTTIEDPSMPGSSVRPNRLVDTQADFIALDDGSDITLDNRDDTDIELKLDTSLVEDSSDAEGLLEGLEHR